MDGRTDAGYIPFNSGIGKQAMAKIPGGWHYLSTGTAPDADAKAEAALPTARTVKIKPGKHATGIVGKPTTLIAIDVAMFTNKDVPDDVVYKLVKTVYGGKPALAKALGAFARFNPKHMVRKSAVPVSSRRHQGLQGTGPLAGEVTRDALIPGTRRRPHRGRRRCVADEERGV